MFLVERADAHGDAILLLDEPGLSLHPLAPRDLSECFAGLAKDNQLFIRVPLAVLGRRRPS